MVVTMGLRPDFPSAAATGSFWIKFAFTGLLAGAGGAAVKDLARPDGSARNAAVVGGVAVLVMVTLAVGQLLASAPEDYRRLVMGSTALVCPWLIVLLAAPDPRHGAVDDADNGTHKTDAGWSRCRALGRLRGRFRIRLLL